MNFLLQWNCNGLTPHLDELLHFLDISPCPPLIIALQECDLYSDNLPHIANYKLTHTKRLHKGGGGTCCYVLNSLEFNVIEINNTNKENIEISAIMVNLTGKIISLYNIYIHPKSKASIADLEQIKINNNCIIIGDFNAKSTLWGSSKTDNRGKILENFIEKYSLVCLNNKVGTRLNHDGSLSHLDVALASCSLGANCIFSVLEDRWGSDHFPIKIEIQMTTIFNTRKNRESKTQHKGNDQQHYYVQ